MPQAKSSTPSAESMQAAKEARIVPTRRRGSAGDRAAAARDGDPEPTASHAQRQMIARFCRSLGTELLAPPPLPAERIAAEPSLDRRPLAPRVKQTLDLLLAGQSEKQIARALRLSPHTVHDYVKTLYRDFEVTTRAELLALWVRK